MSRGKMRLSSRQMVLVWASLWMLAAPLFHVHPDVDHRHGEPGHVHGSTVHTVLSRDLDCEFDSRGQIRADAQAETTLASHLSHGGGHPEFGLSLLHDSSDRKTFKQFSTPVLPGARTVIIDPRPQGWETHLDCLTPAVSGFIREIPSRAPPGFLI